MKKSILLFGVLLFFAASSSVFSKDLDKASLNGSVKVKEGVLFSKLSKISIISAVKSVMKKYPEAVFKSIRLQEEDDFIVYEVLILDGKKDLDVKVDAGTGKILKVDNDAEKKESESGEVSGEEKSEKRDNGEIEESESENEGKEVLTKKKEEAKSVKSFKGTIYVGKEKNIYRKVKISPEQVVNIASLKNKGKIVKIEVEGENGYLVYTIEMIKPEGGVKEFLIDAGNGKILKIEHEKDIQYKKVENDDEEKEED